MGDLNYFQFYLFYIISVIYLNLFLELFHLKKIKSALEQVRSSLVLLKFLIQSVYSQYTSEPENININLGLFWKSFIT